MKNAKPVVKVTCSTTDCTNNLHCFNHIQRTAAKRLRNFVEPGVCRECGASLIDWKRVHRRERRDVKNTFAALKHEYIRHHFWHRDFNETSRNHALRLGRTELIASIPRRLRQAVGRARHPREGQQVPVADERMSNVVQYAQHAVAACCRSCIEKWHGIELGRDLKDDEIDYLADLVQMFLQERLDWLPARPTHVPRRRKKR